jgi:predicted nucleic acid-binding protein
VKAVYLDSGPLGKLSNLAATAHSESVRQWAESLLQAGVQIIIPEICDYEVRRELLRSGHVASVRRLNHLKSTSGFRFAPVSSEVFLRAADLWAETRRTGRPTADRHALDGDVILAATVLIDSPQVDDGVVATENLGHLARFVPVDMWQNISH